MSNTSQPVWTLTRGHLEEKAGRPLTDGEAARVAKCLGHSTIGDVIDGALDSCGLQADDEDE